MYYLLCHHALFFFHFDESLFPCELLDVFFKLTRAVETTYFSYSTWCFSMFRLVCTLAVLHAF